MLADLARVVAERVLTREEIAAALDALLANAADEQAKADLLTAWTARGETAEELAACAEALLPRALDPGVRGTWHDQPLLDCCGTGGGGLNLLNISTGLMFVLAAMGIPVVKHGNRGVTKRSGSADVLEAMGIRVDLPPGDVMRCLEEIGCAFLFAPAYHPSFAAVAHVRRSLAEAGQRTVFNLLGPLLNPARPDARLVGVFRATHVQLYQEALALMHCPRFTVVHGEDAGTGKSIGEVSAQGLNTFGSTVPLAGGGMLTELALSFQERHEPLDSILVEDAADSAARLEAILGGEETGLGRQTLLFNAAIASWTHGTAASFEEGVAQAAEVLDSGAALRRLHSWRRFSKA